MAAHLNTTVNTQWIKGSKRENVLIYGAHTSNLEQTYQWKSGQNTNVWKN